MGTAKWILPIGVVLASVVSTQLNSAQQAPSPTDLKTDLKKDIEALSQAVTGIQNDLQEIKTLLRSRPPAPGVAAPQNFVLDLGNHPVKGLRTAQLTLVEFSDYECPFCGRYVRDTWPQLEKEYIETGKLKSVFVDFPLESIHKQALKAAEAARCAGEQDKYWEMHDRLFANQKTLSAWTEHARAVGLDGAKFETCLQSGKYVADIRKDLTMGQGAGITGTPGFFLAVTDPASNKVKTLRVLKGAQPYAAFKAQIDGLLAELETAGTKNR
jgi:protein-disulfide isomerase